MRILVLIIFTSFSLSIYGQIERIEPPFWWKGMENTQLQLMLYGQQIADYQVEIPALDS
ncbi:MAG: cyclomaltodextrinase N-terminal domain-containing protein, partial [Flavobacteriaceae bacterium]